jgi:hypothetical protein
VLVESLPTNANLLGQMMQYESNLDRGFHRDTFLLLQLQKESEESAVLPRGIPAKSKRKTNVDSATSGVG